MGGVRVHGLDDWHMFLRPARVRQVGYHGQQLQLIKYRCAIHTMGPPTRDIRITA